MGEENVNSAESTSSQDVAQASSVTSSAEDACTITSSASNVHVVAPNVLSAVVLSPLEVVISSVLQQIQASLQSASERRERAELEYMPHGHPMGVPIAVPSAPPMSTVQHTHLGAVAPNVSYDTISDSISSALRRIEATLQVESEHVARERVELEHMISEHMPMISEHMPHGHPMGVPIAVPSTPPMPTTQYTHSGSNDLRNSNFTHNSYLSGVSSGTSQQQAAVASIYPIDALRQMDRHQLMTKSSQASSVIKPYKKMPGRVLEPDELRQNVIVRGGHMAKTELSNGLISYGAEPPITVLIPSERELRKAFAIERGISPEQLQLSQQQIAELKASAIEREIPKQLTQQQIAKLSVPPPTKLEEAAIRQEMAKTMGKTTGRFIPPVLARDLERKSLSAEQIKAVLYYPDRIEYLVPRSTMPAGEPSTGIGQQQPGTIDELSNSSPAERTSPLAQQPEQPQAQSQEHDTPTQLLDQASATSANDRVVRKSGARHSNAARSSICKQS